MGRVAFIAAISAAVAPSVLQAQDAQALRARHAALSERLASNPFGRPLHVESSEASGAHAGEVFALVEQPYAAAGPALQGAQRWCQILILPVNVKRCEVPGSDTLAIYVARKPREAVDEAYRVAFRYEVAAAAPDYLRVVLSSAQGPFGTTDYRITLEAAPIDAQRTFIHMSYSYVLGFGARLAMNAYLATSGRDKVGFSVIERRPDGQPVYVDGPRGVIERNTMRYYLAIEAYLDALEAPAHERLERRLREWYAGIERYPRQLEEAIKREEYLRMKLAEARHVEGESAAGAGR